MRIGDGVFGVVLMLVAAGVLWHVRGFPSLPGYLFGPGFFPTLIMIGLLICGGLLTLRGVKARRETAAAPAGEDPDAPVASPGGRGFGVSAPDWTGAPRHAVSVALALGSALAFYLLGETVGFQILSFVSLLVFYLWLGRGLVWSFGLALAITLLFDLLFRVVLRVPLPSGYFPLLW